MDRTDSVSAMAISVNRQSKRASASALAMSAMLGFTGSMHFLQPRGYDRLIPASLPGTARQWTLGSGVAEFVVAGLVALPRTRRFGGRAATLLFLGVYPANLKMAWDFRHKSAKHRAVSLARLPMQAGLIAWSESVRRGV